MTIDQLREKITSTTKDKLAKDLSHWIDEWKKDDRTVDQLTSMVEKFFGTVWFENEEDHKTC